MVEADGPYWYNAHLENTHSTYPYDKDTWVAVGCALKGSCKADFLLHSSRPGVSHRFFGRCLPCVVLRNEPVPSKTRSLFWVEFGVLGYRP